MKRSSVKFFGKVSSNKTTILLWGSVLRNGGRSVKLLLFGMVTLLLSTGTAFGVGATASLVSRNLSSSAFPMIAVERNTRDILDTYPAYLKFVYEVGKTVDRDNAAKLVKIYESLRRRNPKQAALFLKGLRFELVEKIELMGRDPRQISTSTPDFRRWVARYLREWVREADEHLFRTYASSKSELALAE